MTTITLEIVLWDETKADALISKIEHDARVLRLERLS